MSSAATGLNPAGVASVQVKVADFLVQDGPAGSVATAAATFGNAMQWSWPAVVNYYEAKACCGCRAG